MRTATLAPMEVEKKRIHVKGKRRRHAISGAVEFARWIQPADIGVRHQNCQKAHKRKLATPHNKEQNTTHSLETIAVAAGRCLAKTVEPSVKLQGHYSAAHERGSQRGRPEENATLRDEMYNKRKRRAPQKAESAFLAPLHFRAGR